MAPIRVLLADDHAVVRAGIRSLLILHPEIAVVGEASDGLEAVTETARLCPHVVVMDLAMPNLNGIEATQRIVDNKPEVAVVVLSMHSSEEYVLRALKAGARAYVLKESTETDLISAVRAAAAGKSFFSTGVSRLLLDDYTRLSRVRNVEDRFELLTPREREILQLAAEGKSNKEIAGRLCVSIYTVETHRRNMMEKIRLRGTTELILYAIRKGLISPENLAGRLAERRLDFDRVPE